MKILCETQIVNRGTPSSRSSRAKKKATLAIGYHTTAKDPNGENKKQLEIIHFTQDNRTGTRYKVKANIEKVHTKFVLDGKATISFRQPPENLMIRCDPIQLKAFLQTLKLGIDGKESVNLRLNIAAATAIPKNCQGQDKMVVVKRGDYPTKGFPRSLKSLTISGIGMQKVSFGICSLRNLTTLVLSYNNLTKLPAQLGRLALTELHIDNNDLGQLNDWQWLHSQTIRRTLRHLDLSLNNLSYFPLELIKLEQLVTLKLNHNMLLRIPFGVRRMRSLRYLHVSSNRLESLPAAFNETRLEMLDIWGNSFKELIQYPAIDDISNPSSVVRENTPPPLWLLASRAVDQYKLPYTPATLPWMLVDIISELPRCACGHLCYAGVVFERAAGATFDNTKELIYDRRTHIFVDMVLCGAKCAGRRMIANFL